MNFTSSLKYSQNKNQGVELIQYQSITIGTAQMRGTNITGKEAVSIHANLHDTYPYQAFSEQVAS